MIRDLARRRATVVTALTVGRDAGVIKAGGNPGQRAMAGAAFLRSGHMVTGHGGGLHAGVTGTACVRNP